MTTKHTPGPWYVGSGTYEGRNIYSAAHASCGDLEMSPALFQAQRAIARATGESE